MAKEEAPVIDERIPSEMHNNPIFITIFKQFLSVVDEINSYNETVLAKKDNEWNRHKILAHAKSEARPEDANKVPDADLLPLVQELENAQEALNFARDAVIAATAEKLGISLSAVGGERDPEKETALKELRKKGSDVGNTIRNLRDVLADPEITAAISAFLDANPLPVVGREQAKSFSEESTSTPRYRVKVTVVKNGNELLSADGFSKAAMLLRTPAFGYERGKAPTADKLREVWEATGNRTGAIVQSSVEFEDNGLTYTITHRA